MKKFLFTITASLLLAGSTWAQWTNPLSAANPPNGGWNRIVYVPDNGKYYLMANDAVYPASTLMQDALWEFDPATNTWTQLTRCGDNAQGAMLDARVCLTATVNATDTPPFTLTVKFGGACNATQGARHLASSGALAIEDELFLYDSCTGCATGSTEASLHITARGQKQAIGYTGPVTHTYDSNYHYNAWGHAACYGDGNAGNGYTSGFLNGVDQPALRHPVTIMAYDSKRGRLTYDLGSHETFAYKDDWWYCVAAKYNAVTNPEGCTTAQVSGAEMGWHRTPIFAANPVPPGWVDNSTYLADNSATFIYDPDHDRKVKFGGTPNYETYAWEQCQDNSTSTSALNCSGNQYVWKKITTGSGRGVPLGVAFARGSWDPIVHRVIFFGGQGSASGPYYHVVQQFDPATGEWCLDDLSQGGTNTTASWCWSHAGSPMPGRTGPVPAPNDTSSGNRYSNPAWTFVPALGKHAYYAGGNVVYLYDAAANAWSSVTTTSGPTIPAGYTPGQSWAATRDTLVYVIGAGASGTKTSVYRLPISALSAPAKYTLTVSRTGTGVGTVVSGETPTPYVNCGGSCSHDYNQGNTVTLTATAQGGSTFSGWGGACSAAGTSPICNLTMDAARDVSATFNAPAATGTVVTGTTVTGVQF